MGSMTRYLQGKLTIYGIMSIAVNQELPSVSDDMKIALVGAMAEPWVGKCNYQIMDDGTESTNLKIDTRIVVDGQEVPGGGLQVKTDGTVHYWTNEGVDMGNVAPILILITKVNLRMVYDFAVANITGESEQTIFIADTMKDITAQTGFIWEN